MRLIFILLSLAILRPAEAQYDWKYELGFNFYESGTFYKPFHKTELRFSSDVNMGYRFKAHHGNSAYRLGLEFYANESDFDRFHEWVESTMSYTGDISYRQIELNAGYQYSLHKKFFSVYGALDFGYSSGKAEGDYFYWGCFSAGSGNVDAQYKSFAVSPVAGLTIKPFTHWSLTLESRYQFAYWYIDYPDGGTKKQYYPNWFPISTLSFNYLFGKDL